MSADRNGEVRGIREQYRIPLAVGIGCYVLTVIVGMFLLADHFGPVVQVPLWILHGVLLAILIEKLGTASSSLYASLFIVFTSVMSAYVIGVARDDLTLQHRGEKVTATVVKERLDPPQGRKARLPYYTLERQDGTRVPGPEMEATSDLYDIGQVLTVIADPKGELRPQTPGQADATGDVVSAGAFALAAIGSVGWMTWRGSDAARRRDEQKGPGRFRKAYKSVTRDNSTQAEQERKLREALRTYPADRRGYIKVAPEEYPDLTHGRAARIAWETGLRAEAVGNRGSWRFKETVVDEVPLD
ncbi:hypothetical protein ACFY9S_08500 [Streptomyces sp. NPDC012474]|uniref:hypothetical protein n=1 Tax=Streptomyces sp. NPDC012474 TaxID=3364836 RepID=UPI0036ED6574